LCLPTATTQNADSIKSWHVTVPSGKRLIDRHRSAYQLGRDVHSVRFPLISTNHQLSIGSSPTPGSFIAFFCFD
jgi:hypothetical protein